MMTQTQSSRNQGRALLNGCGRLMLATVLGAALAMPASALPPRGKVPDELPDNLPKTPTKPPTKPDGGANTDDEVPVKERQYLVEVLAIEALDETGPDFPGSNEVYGVFSTTYGPTAVTINPIYTKVLGNVDAGDRRVLSSDQRCLGPYRFSHEVSDNDVVEGYKGERWTCIDTAAPLVVEFKLWESDIDLPEPWTWFPVEFDVSGIDPLAKLDDDDDLIGHDTITFTPGGLARDLPRVGASETYTRTLSQSGRFNVTFKVTRHR